VEDEWLSETEPAPSGRRSFVFVGRFDRLKGVQELQRALERLAPDFDFHFVGPIPENEQLHLSHVHYWGLETDPAKLRERLQTCDVLVCPSFSEGMPTVILEGMASGLAVIATDVGAVPDIVSDKNGWLIPPANFEALLAAMRAAVTISDSELAARGRASRELVKRSHLWEGLVDRTIEAIEGILAQGADEAQKA
jgi:glycosyltransferase involved in cell wall biosynthesis